MRRDLGRWLGAALFVLGIWVFLGPFIGPAMHLYFVMPSASAMGMKAGGTMGNMNAVVVNPGMVFFNFLPGVVLTMTGLYRLFASTPSQDAA